MIRQSPTYAGIAVETQRDALLQEFPDSEPYIERFAELEPQRFAVIKVGGEIIDDPDQLSATAYDIARLQALGLTPIVVHGGGHQIDTELERRGLSTEKRDGIRITRKEHMPAVAPALTVVNKVLCGAIADHEGKAMGISNIFTARLGDQNDLGSVEEVTNIDTSLVEAIAKQGRIAVVGPIGHQAVQGAEAQLVNINADISATALAISLQVLKYISLTKIGGITEHGKILDNLSADRARQLIADGKINNGAKPKVVEALRLVDHGVHDVVITKPSALMQELFTDEGAGTIIHVDD